MPVNKMRRVTIRTQTDVVALRIRFAAQDDYLLDEFGQQIADTRNLLLLGFLTPSDIESLASFARFWESERPVKRLWRRFPEAASDKERLARVRAAAGSQLTKVDVGTRLVQVTYGSPLVMTVLVTAGGSLMIANRLVALAERFIRLKVQVAQSQTQIASAELQRMAVRTARDHLSEQIADSKMDEAMLLAISQLAFTGGIELSRVESIELEDR